MPKSIHLFGRLYLASIALYVVSTVIDWSALVAASDRIPGAQGTGVAIAAAIVAIVALAQLLLWFAVVRRRSTLAKWLAVLFFALNLWGVLGRVELASQGSVAAVVSLASIVVQGVAIALLFFPESTRWLRATGDEPEAGAGLPRS